VVVAAGGAEQQRRNPGGLHQRRVSPAVHAGDLGFPAEHVRHRPGHDALQRLVSPGDERLAFELDRDFAAEAWLVPGDLGEDGLDFRDPVGQVLSWLGTDLRG